METEMSVKRRRSANWSSEEKHILRELIKEQIDTLEDKRIDSITSSIKRKAWANILERFNKLNRKERSISELRLQWKNTKLRRQAQFKRFRDAERQYEADFNVQEEKIEVVDKVSSEESSDIGFYLNTENCSSNILGNEVKYEDMRSQDAAFFSERQEDANTDTQPMDEYYKNELFLITKAMKEKELEYMREEHEARMKSIQMERDQKLRFMEEEHIAKMKILKKSD